jgi:hypothetical protein
MLYNYTGKKPEDDLAGSALIRIWHQGELTYRCEAALAVAHQVTR